MNIKDMSGYFIAWCLLKVEENGHINTSFCRGKPKISAINTCVNTF